MNKAMLFALARVAGLAGLVGVAGCTQTRVVLLPDATGKVGQVDVQTEGETRTLSRAYQTAVADRSGSSEENLGADQVRQRFGAVIDNLPFAPQRYVMYFETGADTLSEASKAQVAHIRTALGYYAAPEIIVTGHTDRVGPGPANDALSLKRAELVRELLVAEGFAREQITVAGRGEREPAVPTDDEVDEPRNRRVEVKIR